MAGGGGAHHPLTAAVATAAATGGGTNHPSAPPSSAEEGRPGTASGGAARPYTTLAAPHTHVLEVKRSKFIATAWPVSSPAEALALIAGASVPAASHNCWAFVCGPAARCSDDGEPSGTAGRPILAAIEGEPGGLDGVAVLVVRYFGGIKLGPGGLVRAYGGVARDCVRDAGKVEVEPASRLTITAPARDVGAVYACLMACGGEKDGEEEYGCGDGGTVTLRAVAPRAAVPGLVEALASRTAGRAGVTVAE